MLLLSIKKLLKLEQITEINNKYYTQLLEKETEHELNNAGITTYNEILESAPLSEIPISPNKILIYLIFFFSGILICVVVVLINYITHDKITALHEINKYSSREIPILGMIPFLKNKMEVSQLVVDKSPKSMLTESFRAIRTNLQFINNDSDSKVIAVSRKSLPADLADKVVFYDETRKNKWFRKLFNNENRLR